MSGERLQWGTLIPKNRILAIGAGALLVLSVLQISNLEVLPFSAWFCSATGSLLTSATLREFLLGYGYASLFVLMTLESASVPIPSEIILPLAGVLVSEGVLGSLEVALVVSTAAAVVGALIDFYLALFLGRPFVVRVLRGFRLDPKDLDRAEAWFQGSGQWTVFAARFVPLLRSLISLPAGLFRMSLRPFLLMTVVGCAVWNGVLLYAGFAVGGFCAGAGGGGASYLFAAAIAASSGAYLGYFLFAGGPRSSTLHGQP